MPNTREKLIELLDIGLDNIDRGALPWAVEMLANHLIAHGVTVQEWISVKDRLPEEMDWVLCYCVDKEVHILRYDYLMDDWDIHNRPNSCYGKGFVTHWQPMPQPPKGE